MDPTDFNLENSFDGKTFLELGVNGEAMLKKGKLAFVPDDRDFKFTDFVNVAEVLPKVPVSYGHDSGITDWGMLGNDQYGDCTCAGACHEHMLLAHAQGKPVPAFTPDNALALYSAVTGFKKGDPSTDQGAQVRDVLNYRRKHGVKDSAGKVHKIDGFVSVDPTNLDHLRVAGYVFEIIGIGFAFPDYAMDQFNSGKPWTYEAGKPAPTEGHYVPRVGHRNGLSRDLTWGREQGMNDPFHLHYVDEVWAIYSRELIAKSGKSLEGFDQAALDKVLAAL